MFQQEPVRDHKRHVNAGARHLAVCDAQEVDCGEVVVEDDEDGGLRSVVFDGTGGGEVAEVGCKAGGHGDGSDGAALPLQEKGPHGIAPPQDAECVWLDGVEFPPVAEVAGGPARRVELDGLHPVARTAGRRGDEGVDGLGVLDVAEALAAARSGDVAPGERLVGIDGRRLQRCRAAPTDARSARASAARARSVAARRRRPSTGVS